ncbi:hypothetical protein D3C87_95270 [compost metagenome]
MKTPKYTLLYLLIGSGLTSCVTHQTIVQAYSSEDPCDCITKHPLLPVGTGSTYFSTEKAVCLPVDYTQRRDSISRLEARKDQAEQYLEDEAFSQDSINKLILAIDSDLQNLKKGWTHAKIKTKWKVSADNEALILKQKKVFYNNYKSGRKRVGKKEYRND